jgi:MoaA/NifB/PqqE/SkfB family radical SAM enzyme
MLTHLDVKLQEFNGDLNQKEFTRGVERAASTPRHITLGTHNACNAKCVFCLEGNYTRFSLELYREFFEGKMGHYLRNAESLTFTGFGELLWVPGIEKFLDYINETLPNTKKVFTTNGSPLTPMIAERLLQGDNTIQVSLHAAGAALHQKLTGLEGQFEPILANIRALIARRAVKREAVGTNDWQTVPFLRLFSVLNAHNIDDAPAFVQQAYDLGVQGVRLFYMTVFAPEHIELSCFFDPERADRAIRRARELAEALRWRDPARAWEFELPPLFSEPAAPAPSRCSDPWQYLYVELMGAVMPCCQWGKHIGNLHEDSVDDLWNGELYRGLRKGMASGEPHPWCRSCIRWTGYNVNNILSHLTNRPAEQRKLLREIFDRGLLKNPSDEIKRMISPRAVLEEA